MIVLLGTQGEKLEKIARLTNADLFDAWEEAALNACQGIKAESFWEYAQISAELERRLQRIGFLPAAGRLAEIRAARDGKK